MNVRHLTPILNVSSVPGSIAWFEKLGWERSFTWNDGGAIEGAADANDDGKANFGGVCSGEATILLCLDGQGGRGAPAATGSPCDAGGMWMSWWLETPAEVDAAHERALERGVTVTMPPRDEPWGVRECRILHPDGHVFRLSSSLQPE